MKNFKNLLSEVSQPKSGEEMRFKDQHKIELIKHPVALDHQFTGEIEGLTKKPRSSDQKDDSAYDQAYLVKNKQFKMPRDIDEDVELEEKAESQAQQKLMGMALAYKRGEMDDSEVSDQVKDLAKSMSEKDLEDFAKTKHKNLPKKVQKESVSFKNLLEKVSPSSKVLGEDAEEEIEMMMRQLHFIAYAADEIMEYLAIDNLDPEEWWQNKLNTAFVHMQSLHSYVEGDKRMMDSNVFDKMEDFSFESGEFVLENNETVELSEEDAEILSTVFESLDESNRDHMFSLMLENEENFQEVLEFAREVLE
jgi:hypothetical protein